MAISSTRQAFADPFGRARRWAAWVAVVTLMILSRAQAAEPGTEQIEFFEKHIRPLLAANCFECHSADKQKGGLQLDSAAGLFAGGELGPVVVPGKPTESLLIRAVNYNDAALQMPPKAKLAAREIELLTQWVAMGAPWPGAELEDLAREREHGPTITDEDRAFWSFQPIARPAPPDVPQAGDNPIDRFILARLHEKGLASNPPASPRELIRRVYFNLIGLPPSAQEIAAFEADPSDAAYEAMIDRLLAMPQYGERWARHWLDVVRYAQSNGYERDNEKPYAWRYRDYVVKSFNEDKPYDRFVIEQLAGDELPDRDPDTVTATGFYRLGVWDDEPDDARMAEFDALDDIAHVTGSAFMGMTIGCARCHEHKFDPISHEDYYEFIAFFRNVRQYENPREALDSSNLQPLIDHDEAQRWQAEKDARIKSAQDGLFALRDPIRKRLVEARLAELPPELRAAHDTPQEQRTDEQKKQAEEAAKRLHVDDKQVNETLDPDQLARNEALTMKLNEAKALRPPWEWALAVTEHQTPPPATHVLIRGNASTPGKEVQPAFLAILGGGTPDIPPRDEHDRTTGLRLAMAKWIASEDNPLTARVMVNRIWQHHFGTPIVATPNDFGRAGVPPTHPDLLDFLASRFIEDGWSIKSLHRLILTSRTYRQSSRNMNDDALAIDPGNTLYWRQNMRRLEAEAIRDSVLAVSGTLNPAMGGPSFFPQLGGEVVAGASKPGFGWGHSSEAERARRSIYIFVKRTMLVPFMETLDYTGTESPMDRRPITTIAPQALLMLNSRFMRDQAAILAERVAEHAPDDPAAQMDQAFLLALGRLPSVRERETALAFMERQERGFSEMTGQIVFRPDAAEALFDQYLYTMPPEDLLEGPRDGWSYHRGHWGGGYSGIKEIDDDGGPFALRQDEPFADGRIDARLRLDATTRFASILFRGGENEQSYEGYEVRLDAANDALLLLRHADKKAATLARIDTPIDAGTWQPLRIEISGPNITVRFGEGETALLKFIDPDPIVPPGRFGLRARGGPVTFADLAVTNDAQRSPVTASTPDDRETARRRALESLCLLMFNLNEFVYVD